MADHMRSSHSAQGKRSALASAQRNAYVHTEQVGGSKRREADGRWVDRKPVETKSSTRSSGPVTIGEFARRNSVYILSVVAVVALVAMLLIGVRAFSGSKNSYDVPHGEEAYESAYDWSKLDRSNGHYAYVVDGQVRSKLGIDVADYQGEIDWNAVAGDGIDFAIIRLGYRGATEGELYLDDYYEENLVQAKKAGLDCGVYFFSQAVTADEAREEAEFVLQNLSGVRLEYPIAYDFEHVTALGETRTAGLSDNELEQIAEAFCSRIEEAGYQTLVYGNAYDLSSYSIDMLTGRGIWWAEYDVSFPSHFADIVLWQYTSSGSVDGVSTAADMNIDLRGVASA